MSLHCGTSTRSAVLVQRKDYSWLGLPNPRPKVRTHPSGGISMRHHNVGVWNQESCFTFTIYAFLWQNIQWSSLFLSTLKVADCAPLGSPPVCVGIRSKKSAKVFFVWESKKLKFDGKTRISCSKLHRVGGGSIWGRHFAGMGDFPAWPSTRQRSPSIGTTN